MKVLVIKLSAFGDILSTSPVFSSIRKKVDELDHLVFENYNIISRQNPHIDETHTIKKNKLSISFISSLFKTIYKIRKKKYDVCFLFHRSLLLNILLKLSGIKVIYGFKLSYNKLLKDYVSYDVKKNRTYQEFDILNLFFINIPYPKNLEFYIDDSAIKLKASKEKYIVIAIGGGNIHSDVKNRAWPINKYIEVINALPNYKIYILGSGKYDLDLIKNVNFPTNTHNLIDNTNINEAAYLIRGCQYFIGHDMGLIHLAAAMGANIIGIYGPTNPDLARPLAGNFVTIQSNHYCSPCYNPIHGKNGQMYKCSDNICMQKIESEQVIKIIKK